MSRRHSAVKRLVKPDSRYDSVLLAKFINNVMKGGKKSVAEGLVYGALDRLKKKYKVEPFEIFKVCMDSVKPNVEVKSTRFGGASYQVPSPVSERRGDALAIRWVVAAALKRSGRGMIEKLSEEFFDASNGRGIAIKKREDTHKMAESNKAFSHLSQRNA